MGGIVDMGVCPITLTATGAITAQRFVSALGAQTGAAGNAIGVASTDAAIGEPFVADTLGVVTVTSGAAVAAGALVESDAQGRAVTRTAGAILARTLDAATAAGQPMRVSLIPN